jgi:hypothetical protein
LGQEVVAEPATTTREPRVLPIRLHSWFGDLPRPKEDEGLAFEQSRFDPRLDLALNQHGPAD